MTEFEMASLFLRGVVGAGQIAVVAVGIHFMRQMNKDRARQVEAQRAEADQREKRADQRHAEAMRALEALIKGMDHQAETSRALVKGMEQQGESLRAAVKGMEQQGESLRGVVKGMEAVIERTAPRR